MPGEPITIVSGLPRSGTSMMMRMIAAAGIPPLTDNLRRADDDNPDGYYEYEPVKATRADPSWLSGAGGKVVKMVHILLLDLPEGHNYRIVMMQRDLDEVVASQAKMLERSGRKGAAAEVLKRVYGQQMEQVRAWMAARANVSSIDVSYNRVMAEPAGEAARVAAFLGLPDSAGAMAATVKPDLYRNRRA